MKPNKKQLKIMRKHWKLFQQIHKAFIKNVEIIEYNMSKECGIEGMVFFVNEDGEYCGIGNENKKLKLTHDTELGG